MKNLFTFITISLFSLSALADCGYSVKNIHSGRGFLNVTLSHSDYKNTDLIMALLPKEKFMGMLAVVQTALMSQRKICINTYNISPAYRNESSPNWGEVSNGKLMLNNLKSLELDSL